jgi:hypothetical protein
MQMDVLLVVLLTYCCADAACCQLGQQLVSSACFYAFGRDKVVFYSCCVCVCCHHI